MPTVGVPVTWGRRVSANFHVRVVEGQFFGAAVRSISYSVNIPVLDDELQDWSVFWFKLPFGSNALDKSSRDGYFIGRSWDVAIDYWSIVCSQTSTSRLTRRSPPPWRRSFKNSNFRKRVQQEEGRLKKMIDSFAEDGSVTRSLNTSGWLVLTWLLLNYSGPFSAILRGDDVQGFDTRWDCEFCPAIRYPRTMSWRACT